MKSKASASCVALRWPAVLAMAGVLCASAGAALAQSSGDNTITMEKPSGGKGIKSAFKPGKPGMEVFLLPANYRNANGSFNQEALVAQQKKRIEVINERLGTHLRLAETPHYIIFSDADADVTGQFLKWSEALYANLCRVFAIDPKERVWDGKCILQIFTARPKFELFGKIFDENNVSDAGAYFAWETYAVGEPQCVHICIPLDERQPRRLQELFAHEGTHAFFQLYRKAVDLPLWLHEGLAEYMTVVNDPLLAPMKTTPARRIARSETPVARILKAEVGDDFALEDYSVAYTMVDCLEKVGGNKFKQFVCLIKEGKDQDTAMKSVYGFDCESFQARWRAYLTTDSAPPRKR